MLCIWTSSTRTQVTLAVTTGGNSPSEVSGQYRYADSRATNMSQMAANPRRSGGRRGVAVSEPAEPDLPDDLTIAGLDEADVHDGAVHYGLAVTDLDLSDTDAANLEIDQC